MQLAAIAHAVALGMTISVEDYFLESVRNEVAFGSSDAERPALCVEISSPARELANKI